MTIKLELLGFTPLERAGVQWFLRNEEGIFVEWESQRTSPLASAYPSEGTANEEQRIVLQAISEVEVGEGFEHQAPENGKAEGEVVLEVCPARLDAISLMRLLRPHMRRIREEEEVDSARDQLSAREKQVLSLIAQGLSNKEIADRLCISTNTAITHRRNLVAKLGIRSAAGLSLYAYMHGLR